MDIEIPSRQGRKHKLSIKLYREVKNYPELVESIKDGRFIILPESLVILFLIQIVRLAKTHSPSQP